MPKDRVKITRFAATAKDAWNAFVTQWPGFVLMQSYEWGAFKEALGWKVIRLAAERDGQPVACAQILIRTLAMGLASIVYVPRGPLLDWEDDAVVQPLLSAIHAVARKHRAIVLKIEPAVRHSPKFAQQFKRHGFQYSGFNNQPQCSMLIDLTPDIDTILANMHKTTRYNIRYSARKGVVVREATVADLDTFFDLLRCTANRAGFAIRSRRYYYQEWKALAAGDYLKLYLALHDGELLAARMLAAFGDKAATLHSGSYDVHRNLKPNELLMWESLKWAKARGCTTFDVWGIPNAVGAHLYLGQPLPADQNGELWGVYRFKRGFGGDVVYYVGAYDYVYSHAMYWLLNNVTAWLGSLDKLAQLGDRLDLNVGQPAGK